jgi:membrane protein
VALEDSPTSATETRGQLSLPTPDPGLVSRFREFAFRVVSKAAEDNVFFMAGAITFNLLVALVPIILLFIGISGFILSSRFPDPASTLISLLMGNLPEVGGTLELVGRMEGVVNTLLEDRASFSLVGFLVFLWISTRLVGTLRVALREIFDFSHGRGFIHGKVFDGLMVVVGGLLFVVNIGITVWMQTVEEYGLSLLGFEGMGPALIRQVTGQILAFASIWTLFFLIYRYFPPRRIPMRSALVAATFTGILFEISKVFFSFYVTSVADFRSAYGGLTGAAVLFFWIYYGAVVFILGGEVAQVYTISRVRRLHAATPVTGRDE